MRVGVLRRIGRWTYTPSRHRARRQGTRSDAACRLGTSDYDRSALAAVPARRNPTGDRPVCTESDAKSALRVDVSDLRRGTLGTLTNMEFPLLPQPEFRYLRRAVRLHPVVLVSWTASAGCQARIITLGGWGMTEVLFPGLQEESLSFASLARYRDMGDSAPAQPALAGKVLLGGPVAFPMTAQRYPDLRAYLEADKQHHRYYEVHLSLSFSHVDLAPPLHAVTLKLQLTALTGTDQPIAWSMAPSQIDDPADHAVRFELRPQLKLVGVEFSVGTITGTIAGVREPYLLALGELGSNPTWELRRPGRPLNGRQRLLLVVRAPKRSDVELSAEVTAATRSPVLRRFRAVPAPLKLLARL